MARIEYLVCPLCGLNRVVRSHRRAEKGKEELVRFDHARLPEIEDMIILQIREGGGKQPGTGGGKGSGKGSAKGVGFRLKDGLTLKDMIETGDYDEILEDLKAQFLRQLAGFLRTGFISKKEIQDIIS